MVEKVEISLNDPIFIKKIKGIESKIGIKKKNPGYFARLCYNLLEADYYLGLLLLEFKEN